MDAGEIILSGIAVTTLVINIVLLATTAVWVVGKIKTTTEVLTASIRSLGRSVDAMRSSMEKIDDKVDKHGERLMRIETKTEKMV